VVYSDPSQIGFYLKKKSKVFLLIVLSMAVLLPGCSAGKPLEASRTINPYIDEVEAQKPVQHLEDNSGEEVEQNESDLPLEVVGAPLSELIITGWEPPDRMNPWKREEPFQELFVVVNGCDLFRSEELILNDTREHPQITGLRLPPGEYKLETFCGGSTVFLWEITLTTHSEYILDVSAESRKGGPLPEVVAWEDSSLFRIAGEEKTLQKRIREICEESTQFNTLSSYQKDKVLDLIDTDRRLFSVASEPCFREDSLIRRLYLEGLFTIRDQVVSVLLEERSYNHSRIIDWLNSYYFFPLEDPLEFSKISFYESNFDFDGLFWALYFGNEDLLEYWLSRGGPSEITVQGVEWSKRISLIAEAVRAQDEVMILQLLKWRAARDASTTTEIFEPIPDLVIAIQENRQTSFSLLLEEGASVNSVYEATSRGGGFTYTALSEAVRMNRRGMVRALLDRGADPWTPLSTWSDDAGMDGADPVHHLTVWDLARDKEMTELLLSFGE